MPSIRTENADGLLIVTLARGKANALNAAMVDSCSGKSCSGLPVVVFQMRALQPTAQ